MLSAFRGELLGDMMSRLGSTLLGLSRPAFGISDLHRGHNICSILPLSSQPMRPSPTLVIACHLDMPSGCRTCV